MDVNYTLIIILTIVISLPFIISSIVIPILLALDKRKKHSGKSKAKLSKINSKPKQ